MADFYAYYPQISKSSEMYLLFRQCSFDVQLVDYNFIDTLKDNIGNNYISTRAELTTYWMLVIPA